MIKSNVLISTIVRREGMPRNWKEAPENKGNTGIIQYALWYSSIMSDDASTAPLGVRSII